MLRVRTGGVVERITTIKRVTRIGVLRRLAVTSNRNTLCNYSQRDLVTSYCYRCSRSPILATLMMETIRTSKSSVHKRITWRNIPEDDILHSHRHGNLQLYTAILSFSTTDRYSVFREVRTSNLIQQSYPLTKPTDIVFSVR
jgi:hypothetical protein